MIPGWRNDLFTELGFEIDYDPTWFDGDSYAYAHIKAGSKQVGESGPLYYNWYDPTDIFDEQGGMHWDTAEPVYSCSVNIEIIDAEEEFPVYILGDADGSGDVTILDATVIQRYLAALGTNNFVLLNADTNRNGDVDILDATRIQRYLAGFHDGTEIGEEVVSLFEPRLVQCVQSLFQCLHDQRCDGFQIGCFILHNAWHQQDFPQGRRRKAAGFCEFSQTFGGRLC